MVNLYKLLSGRGTLFAFLLSIILMVILAIPIMSGLDGFNALPAAEQKTSNIFNTGLYLVLALLAITVVVTVLWALVQMAMNPAGAKHGLIWVVVIAALFALGYFVLNKPDSVQMLDKLKKYDVSASASKFIGGGIWMMLLMMLGAFLIFIGSEVRNLFK
ncbi:MAG: hypothetical protein KA109_05220 [Saprospiraceae bacterium]|jgi:hypothetical protein|nr:hypothetical protein [Saprospiraceae bacterium]MBK6477176.1 hypothetical protein [Saprospiraceae bacterium]MBK6814523.1 hypothetical protein [Saprospiraceae bacterium]MBK7369910.1 hypothetical protein [Saprospiraceae bacterium]MBK7608737.1 hypothetical protein [Saprospiraceae bacterium]